MARYYSQPNRAFDEIIRSEKQTGSFRFAQFAQQIGEGCAITGHNCADSKGIVRFGTNFSLFRFSQLC